eukprot:9488847-Pyramimonas_sp.AAC.2
MDDIAANGRRRMVKRPLNAIRLEDLPVLVLPIRIILLRLALPANAEVGPQWDPRDCRHALEKLVVGFNTQPGFRVVGIAGVGQPARHQHSIEMVSDLIRRTFHVQHSSPIRPHAPRVSPEVAGVKRAVVSPVPHLLQLAGNPRSIRILLNATLLIQFLNALQVNDSRPMLLDDAEGLIETDARRLAALLDAAKVGSPPARQRRPRSARRPGV